MSEVLSTSLIPGQFNRRMFVIYFSVFALLAVLGIFTLLYKGKYLYLGLAFSIPVLIYFITHPKAAVGQYIFLLFISRTIASGQPWLLTDIGGVILVIAAIVDILSDSNFPERLPRLTLNFILILAVVFIAGVFSYEPVASLRPFGRIAILLIHFLAIYRLSGKVSLGWSLNFFFWLSVFHSVMLVIPFVASGGTLRAYGLAPVEMPMLALVIGTIKLLWAKKGTAWLYLLSLVLIFFALLSQQFRSLIMFGAAMSVMTAFFCLHRAMKVLRTSRSELREDIKNKLINIPKRPIYIITGVLMSISITILMFPGLLEPLSARFENLLSKEQSGSVITRFTLWKSAWTQFLEHPLTGIGPGLFKKLHTLIPEVRLNFYHWFVEGLSAHNMILHFLAETGIFGGVAVLMIMINQMRLSVKIWRVININLDFEVTAILLGISLTLLVTTLTEASWLWGQSSFMFSFFAALISKNAALANTKLSNFVV